MKKHLVFCLTFFLGFGCSKNNPGSSTPPPVAPERYKDVVFTSVRINNNIKYGQSRKSNGSGMEDLYLDLYQPEGDTQNGRPLLIGVHGGAFITGDKQAANWPEVCKAYALRGYVAASINYRLGRNAGEQFEPAYRAMQDLKAAIRYARANATVLKIDPEKIFIMGSSAGGATCLITTYMDSLEVPTSINQTIWGNWEGNSGSAGYSSKVKGMVSLWGGIPDTAAVAGAVPVGLIHSLNDPTAPYVSEYDPQTQITTYGSFSIHQRALNQKMKTALKTYYFNGHDDGLYPPYLDTTIRFSVEFLYPLLK